MRILLVGNPNVGKSVLFNRLTGANVLTSNYAGTTVEYAKGRMRVNGEPAELIDAPGTYSLNPTSDAEEVATRMIDDGDVLVAVMDATNLERSLNLGLQVLARRKPTVLALNLWDETGHTGIEIDVRKLEEILGVPCVPTTAISGEGVKTLAEKIGSAKVSGLQFDEKDRWSEVGAIVESVQKVTRKHPTFFERLGDLSVQPVSGILIALVVLTAMFFVIREVGEWIVGLGETYVFDEGFWGAWMGRLSDALGGTGFVHDLLIGRLVDGEIDFGESFGVLTTGLAVPIGAVLPYVFAFYLVLSFLEDSGYLPRLAVLVDTLMHKIGLHGMSIVPMLLGIGCNVPGALATRIMESKRQRFMSAVLMAISIPCMAQTAMVVGLVGEHGPPAYTIIFGTLFLSMVILGLIMNRFMKGESPSLLIDIPPYRIPYIRGLLQKLAMRMKWFLKEAVPWVLFGVLLMNLLYTLGLIQFIGNWTEPVVKGILGLPRDAVGALIIGFLRKDVAVGMLKPLELSFNQIVVASVVLTMYFPCVATFTVMLKEFGIVAMLKATAIMVVTTLVFGGLLNLVLGLAH